MQRPTVPLLLLILWPAAILLVASSAALRGQFPVPVTAAPVPVDFDSGVLSQPATAGRSSVVWADTLIVSIAEGLQAEFAIADLGSDEDRIIVTSVLDSDRQEFDRFALRQWSNRTAWFNGSALTFELLLSPGSSGRIAIERVMAGRPMLIEGGPNTCFTCSGGDSRVASTDNRACRLRGSGHCTGWLIDDQSTILTAEHCYWDSLDTPPVVAPGSLVTAQFNVPLSSSGGLFTPAGSLNNPPAADQFPVLLNTLVTSTSGIPSGANDWAVVRLGNNSSGQSASSRYGVFFRLAPTMPSSGGTVRVTGFGADDTPWTMNGVQQTDTGPFVSFSNLIVSGQVNGQPGNSGGPMIDEGTGHAVGVVSTCSTAGTCQIHAVSVLYTPLRNAIGQVTGCGPLSLVHNVPQSTCSVNTLASAAVQQGKWNVVGLRSDADWNVHMGTVGSTFPAGSAEFVLADGHQGQIQDSTATFYHVAGSAGAKIEFEAARTLTVNVPLTTIFVGSSQVFEVFEIPVGTPGTYHLNTAGDPDLNWRLYAPGSGVWRTFSSAVGAGPVGGTAATMTLSAGWYCLVVYRNGGSSTSLSQSNLMVALCSQRTTLTHNTPVNLVNFAQTLSFTPTSGKWNFAGVSSPSNWNLWAGTEFSTLGGSNADFVVANGHLGGIPGNSAFIHAPLGGMAATAEFEVATTATTNNNIVRTLPAGHSFAVFEFSLSAGPYDISLTGDPALTWNWYNPGSVARWYARQAQGLSGNANDPPQTTNIPAAGHGCLVVSHNGGPTAVSRAFILHVCPSTSSLFLPQNAATTVANACQPFDINPASGAWNGVGVYSTSDWDIDIGTVVSRAGSGTDFLVANGRLGTIAPDNGHFLRFSGGANATASHRSAGAATGGASVSLGASDPFRLYELNSTLGDDFNVSVTGTSGFAWALFRPGSGPGWRSSTDADFNAAMGSTVTAFLPSGASALVIYRLSAVGSGTFTITHAPAPHPVPTITTLNPSFAIAGSASFNLIVTGSGFVSESTVRWAGTSIPTTFVSATQLSASVAASLLTTAGTFPITVFSSAPAGGTSNAVTFEVRNPLPVAAGLSPTQVTALGPSFTVTISGSGFNGQSSVSWQVPPNMPVGLQVSSFNASSITAVVPASLIAGPSFSSAALRVANPAPGGGTSSALSLTIVPPTPGITSLTPTFAAVGSGALTLNVSGSNFMGPAVVLWENIPLPTTFNNQNSLSAAVPAAELQVGGTFDITVNNTGIGGPISNARPFEVRNPVPALSGLSPASVAAGSPSFTLTVTGTGFNSQSEVFWDGALLTLTSSAPTMLGANVPASLVATLPGGPDPSICVRNPTPGGGMSNCTALVIEPGRVVNPANGHVYDRTPIVNGVQEAREWAARMGGYLVAVNDAAEQAFVEANFYQPFTPYWIGLSDEQTEGVWRWDSGERVTYTNWCPGQPGNQGNEDHVGLGEAGSASACWNGVPPFFTGSNPRRGIVEIPPGTQAEFRKVMITEVSWGVPDGLEITNFDVAPADLTAFTVRWHDGISATTSSPLGEILAPGMSITISDDAGPFPESLPGTPHVMAFTVLHGNNPGMVVELLDPQGVAVDTVIISDDQGGDADLPYSGTFRGIIARTGLAGLAGAVGTERIWGLDSDSAADWTEQPNRSMGFRNRSSGPRGVDPIPALDVLINEVDPENVELLNMSGDQLDLEGWFLYSNTADPPGPQAVAQPFPLPAPLADQAFLVVGSSIPPGELPPGVAFRPSPQGFRHNNLTSEVALYDKLGRLRDLLRTTASWNQFVYSNAPLAPSHWSDFRGGVLRQLPVVAVGRVGNPDTGTGADFQEEATRTMGLPNGGFGGLPGFPTDLHLLVEETSAGIGSGTVILNAGGPNAGAGYGQLLSGLPTGGTGPFFGLGFDVLHNLSVSVGLPPFFGVLDAEGSTQYAWPPGLLTGIQLEAVFFIWTPASFHRTLVHIYVGG